MNVCMFFNRSFTKLAHALALDFKKNFGGGVFSGYVYGPGPYKFLREQKDIDYHTILVDDILAVEAEKEIVDEDFLNAKEKEYGTPYLWHTFTVDRHMVVNWPHKFYVKYDPIFNHYQIKQQLQIRIKKIEKMLSDCKPDLIILVSVCSMGPLLLYHIARKKGINCIILTDARLGDKQILTESVYGNFTMVEEKFKKIREGIHKSPKKEDAKNWINSFRNKPIKPYWATPIEQTTSVDFVLFAKNLVRKVLDSFKTDFPKIYDYSVWDYLKRNFLMLINQYLYPQYDKFDSSESYAFFPLHYEPELATMMWAPFYVDQIALIRNIAQSLPLNFKLYVKEHPAMVSLRSPKYYKKLKKIPNVKLINPGIDSVEIIKNAKLITTITGTAGWEAILLRKPVITFGFTFFAALSMVKRLKAIEELPMLVEKCLENFDYKEDEIIDLVSAILEDSFDIDIMKLWNSKDLVEINVNPDFKILADNIVAYHQTLKNDKKIQK